MPSPQKIARLTGLGLATVYRHFPDRRSLLLAATDEHVALLRQAAKRHADDPGAFGKLLRRVLSYQIEMRPVVDELRRCPRSDRQNHMRKLVAALREPFARSWEAGHLKPSGVELADLPVMLSMFQAAVDSAPDADSARRMLVLVLDGLFWAPPPEPDCAQRPCRGEASG